MVTGLRMMRPSEMSLRTVARLLALEISLTSLGSSQILRLPQPATALARRFWVRRLTLQREYISTLRPWVLPLCVRLAIECGYWRRIEIRGASAADGNADSRAVFRVFGGQSNWTVLTSWLLVSC